MYLNNKEKELISKEIEKFEKKSSAELVPVITNISSSYNFEILIFSLLLTSIAALTALFFKVEAIKLFEIEVISFIFFFLLLNRFKNIVLFVLPKAYKYEKASNKATIQFLRLGLNQTKSRQAIMFFVSIDEKYVKIITDENIKKKIEDKYWQKIVNDFIVEVKNKNFSQGYLQAIKACNEILIQNFPIQENDENELSNEVIEI